MFCIVYIARIYISFSFTYEKSKLFILTTKHGLLASSTTRKVRFLAINFCRATNGKCIFYLMGIRRICILTTIHVV